MISVVIATHELERSLVHTLAALVPGALAGLIRDVIVVDAGSRDDTAKVADLAGCHFIVTPGSTGARLAAGAAAARSSWFLFLQPGSVPDTGWIEEVDRFVRECELSGDTANMAAVFRRRLGRNEFEPRQSVVAHCDRAWGSAKAQPGIADRQFALRRARRLRRRQRQSGNRFAPPARPETHCSAQLRDDAGGLISASPCPSASW